ncbi:MAG: hypothetical protein LBE09_08635 [Christensenellaceae bacterium]|jgi:septum formation topological specificity factor MinE|nr:hypothetical protein [Christensenellaceae bacterium]
MKAKNATLKRTQNILANDKSIPLELLEVLTFEVDEILNSYFVYDEQSLELSIQNTDDGKQLLNVSLVIDAIKSFKLV